MAWPHLPSQWLLTSLCFLKSVPHKPFRIQGDFPISFFRRGEDWVTFYSYVRNIKVITNNGLLRLGNGKVAYKEMAKAWNDYSTSDFTIEVRYENQEITLAPPKVIYLSECDLIDDAVTKGLNKSIQNSWS